MHIAGWKLACAQPLRVDVLTAADTAQVDLSRTTRVYLKVGAKSVVLAAEKRAWLYGFVASEDDRGGFDTRDGHGDAKPVLST